MDPFSKQIGRRIQELRRQRGLTLDQLASATGFTKSYLSKVENSRKVPPIGSLSRICSALGADMAALFQSPGDSDELGDGVCLVRAAERRPAVRGGTTFGYDYENLAHRIANKHMQPFLFTFPNNLAEEVFFEHEGEEFLFVISGRLRFVVGAQEWILEPGDSLYFNSEQPHRGEALGEEAKALVVIYTPDREAVQALPYPAHVGSPPRSAIGASPRALSSSRARLSSNRANDGGV